MNIEHLYPYFFKSNKVVIDSRKVQKDDLFFGLKGENTDGNLYADLAIEKGALAAVVDDINYKNEDKSIFYCENSLLTLQELAKHHREKLKIPIIALTGSNGKTTTKELIAAVLSQKYKTLYTEGNYNNHIGVPLTLLSIKFFHEIAVIEMGANHIKEIAFLCDLVKPDYGYITNFGKAHLEGFGGIVGVLKGKSELYEYLRMNHKKVFINSNDSKQIALSKNIKTISFGKESSNYNFILKSSIENKVVIQYLNHTILSHLTGEYNFSSISAAISMGLYFDVEIEKIVSGIENYVPNNQRSQIIKKNNKTIVLDAYNANPSSMEAALKNFSTFKGSKTIILGDMFELGKSSLAEHTHIIELSKKLNFDEIILIGEYFSLINDGKTISFKTETDFKTYLSQHPISSKNILIKGSRGMALEKVLDWI